MRALYAERQAVLLRALALARDSGLQIVPDDAGMHLVGYLPDDADDGALSRRAAEQGIVAPPLSSFYRGRPERKGLLFGYAGVPEPEIWTAAARVAKALSCQGTFADD